MVGFYLGNVTNWSTTLSLTFNAASFVNKVSGVYESEEPPPLRGGIIADPMGLGKTLTMIALAAADLDRVKDVALAYESEGDRYHLDATLIIVPPPRE